jgi:hypothetical protein
MKKLGLFIIAFVIIWPIKAQAQTGNIQGRVVRESTSSPIPEALVYMSANGKTVTVVTDNGGNFIIRDVPPGKHVVYASRDGFFGPSRGAVESNVHTSVTVTAANTSEVSFTLIPGGTLAGRVLVPSGEAAADIPCRRIEWCTRKGFRHFSRLLRETPTILVTIASFVCHRVSTTLSRHQRPRAPQPELAAQIPPSFQPSPCLLCRSPRSGHFFRM